MPVSDYWQFLLPNKSRAAPSKSTKKLYPFSLILIGLWTVFIVALVCWMETAVRRSRQMVDSDDPTLPSLTMDFLPGILLTVFAQAHVPITGIHLARTAVSALQHPSSSPNSWLELFWLADREWLGPVGIIKTMWKSIRSRSRASVTFILFATTSTIALITPVLMTQAYARSTTDLVWDAGPEELDLISSFTRMPTVSASGQKNIGQPLWTTDSAQVLDTYKYIMYHPVGTSRDGNGKLLITITGSTPGRTYANFPGLSFNMSCSPISFSGLNTGDLNTSWPSFCQSHIPQFNGHIPDQGRTGRLKNSGEFSLYSCNNQTGTTFPFTDGDRTQSRNTGYLYYTYTFFQQNKTVSGLIQCNSTLTTGTATVNGFDQTYTNFSAHRFFNTSSMQAQEPLLDPLFATFNGSTSSDVDPGESVFQGIDSESNLEFVNAGWVSFEDCALLTVGRNLENGALAFTTALFQVCRAPTGSSFSLVGASRVTIYIRIDRFAICAYLSLVAWFVLVGAITVRSWRRTFSGSLDSYVAAELIFRKRHLLEGVPIGEADDNELLRRTKFVFPSGKTNDNDLEKSEAPLSVTGLPVDKGGELRRRATFF